MAATHPPFPPWFSRSFGALADGKLRVAQEVLQVAGLDGRG